MVDLQLNYFAAAAEAAGRESETLAIESPTVGDVRALLVDRYGAPMERVLASGSFLVDGVVQRDDSVAVGERIDVLPPFAGG